MVQDEDPCVDPRQVARPKRQQDRSEQERLCAARRDPGHEVRKRKGEHRVGHRDEGRDSESPADDRPVGRVGDDDPEVVDVPCLHDLGRERVDGPERGDEQGDQRRDVEDDEPPQGRREQDNRAQP